MSEAKRIQIQIIEDGKGDLVGTVIEAHVHYEDIREGFLAEKDAIRRRKRREYRQRAKERAEANDEP